MFETIVTTAELAERLGDPRWVVVDCRMDLMRPDAGRAEYEQSHIAGAVYAHLDRDLSGPPVTNSGRHPLPLPAALAETLGRLGIELGMQVVAYDAAGGSIAARLWWLLHYMGHPAAAVLDGGWQRWLAEDRPTESGWRDPESRDFTGSPHEDWVVRVQDVPGVTRLVDARDPARFRGEQEPIDPVAGHIPGAVNHFWRDNLDAGGGWLPPAELSRRYARTLGGYAASDGAVYCGSGVTACHDILAIKHAGLGVPRLYAGSWSEWCGDPSRPVATGPE